MCYMPKISKVWVELKQDIHVLSKRVSVNAMSEVGDKYSPVHRLTGRKKELVVWLS